MVNKEDLWNKNGEINEQAVIPDIDILPSLQIDNFDCDSDFKQYGETLLCDGDNAICVMSVKDDLGNHIDLDLRVRGEVRVGWRENEDEDFEYYKHYSQFPAELTEAIKSGEYYNNDHVDVSENNWLETICTAFDKDEEEVYCDGIMFEQDIASMTPDEVKSILFQIAVNQFESEYQEHSFKKPDITLKRILEYAGYKYSVTEKGDEIEFPDFPSKGVNTYFQRDFAEENTFDIYLNNAKDNTVLAMKSDCTYNCLYNYIMDIACGELECDNGKTIKDNLNKKGKIKQDMEKM